MCFCLISGQIAARPLEYQLLGGERVIANGLSEEETGEEDYILLEYKLGDNVIYDQLGNNHTALEEMKSLCRESLDLLKTGRWKIRVLTYCGSARSSERNYQISRDRSIRIKSYLITDAGMKEDYFWTTNFRKSYDKTLSDITVIYLVEKKDKNAEVIPEIRKQPVVVSPIAPEPIPRRVMAMSPQTLRKPAACLGVHYDAAALDCGELYLRPDQGPVKHAYNYLDYHFSVKANIAYASVAVANFGFEVALNDLFSLELPLLYSPYKVSRRDFVKVLAIQPEFRYWLGHSPMRGHYFGAQLHGGIFNIGHDKYRYQTEKGFYGIGATYGYVLPFANHWAAEFGIGAGYVYTKYDSYYNIYHGARFERDHPLHYFGITSLKIGLTYRFGRVR